MAQFNKDFFSLQIRKNYKFLLGLLALAGVIIIWISDYIALLFINVANFEFGNKIIASIYFLTGVIIFWYTKETYDLKRIQNKQLNHQREYVYRPVILRSYYLRNWDDIDFGFTREELKKLLRTPEFLKFTVLNNIALDIQGYFVWNKYKYKLYFFNAITMVPEGFDYNEKFTWLGSNTEILALFIKNEGEPVNSNNEIFISYKDINGVKYFTSEDSNFSQISGKIK